VTILIRQGDRLVEARLAFPTYSHRVTEIRIDVDLPHPPRRVWQAITDPEALQDWFMATELGGEGFTLRPDGLQGLDEPISGEIVEVISGERLVMRWRAEQLHTLVTATLRPSERGCQLTVVQRGFLGPQGTLRRRVLQRTYTTMVGTRLPAVLERLETAERERDERYRNRVDGPGQVDRWSSRRNQARSFSPIPRQASMAWAGIKAAGRNMSLRSSSAPGLSSWRRRPPARGVAAPAGEALSESTTAQLTEGLLARLVAGGDQGRPGHRRSASGLARNRWAARLGSRHTVAAGASLAMVVLLAVLAVLVERLVAPGDPTAAPAGIPVASGLAGPAPGGVGGTPLPEPTGGVGASPATGGTGPLPVTLTAAYRTDRTIVGGYEGVVTVSNLSASAVNGWSVTIALPPLGLVVRQVEGALAEQDDRQVSFTPVPSNRVVPPGDSIRFTFQVQGVGAPLECSIGGRPCAGVPS
jgi:uncharacterized protein YndB with AHSA1/START domain